MNLGRIPCVIFRALGFIPSITPEGVPDEVEFPVTAGITVDVVGAELAPFSTEDADPGDISLVTAAAVGEFFVDDDDSFINLLI